MCNPVLRESRNRSYVTDSPKKSSTIKTVVTNKSVEIELQSDINHIVEKKSKRKKCIIKHAVSIVKNSRIVLQSSTENVSKEKEPFSSENVSKEKANYILMRSLCNMDLPKSKITSCWSGLSLVLTHKQI